MLAGNCGKGKITKAKKPTFFPYLHEDLCNRQIAAQSPQYRHLNSVHGPRFNFFTVYLD